MSVGEFALTAVNEQQWDGLRILASLMKEMQLNIIKIVDVNGGFKMWQPIQVLFERSPAELIMPVLCDSLDFIDCNTIFPTVTLDSIRELG